jgi:hypothetical protein
VVVVEREVAGVHATSSLDLPVHRSTDELGDFSPFDEEADVLIEDSVVVLAKLERRSILLLAEPNTFDVCT